MDKDDVKRLFRLFRTVYPNAKQFSDPIALEAWAQVLEPCAYDDVKAAALTHMRSKRFPPDVTELTAALPDAERDTSASKTSAYAEPNVDILCEKLYARAAEIRKKYHDVGLLSPGEARLQGISFAEWKSMAEVANGD